MIYLRCWNRVVSPDRYGKLDTPLPWNNLLLYSRAQDDVKIIKESYKNKTPAISFDTWEEGEIVKNSLDAYFKEESKVSHITLINLGKEITPILFKVGDIIGLAPEEIFCAGGVNDRMYMYKMVDGEFVYSDFGFMGNCKGILGLCLWKIEKIDKYLMTVKLHPYD